METLKEKTAKGLFWGGLSNGVQQLLNLIFGIFLARMLSQSDYGMVGMLTIFSAIAGVLQEGGFISALTRKKDVTQRDYNAVFWFNTLVSIALYALLFACAPLIAWFYDVPELTSLARFVFIAFFISSLAIVPGAILYRNLKVREAAIITFCAQVTSGIVGVSLAACGFAYWGIATQTIVYSTVIMIMRFYYTQWHPTLTIDFAPVRQMIGFSGKLIITGIVNIVNNNVFSVLLGKLYTPREVGNYTQANKWNNMGTAVVNSMVGAIAQPVFAKTDDDTIRQKRVFRKLLRFTAFVSFPAMFGLVLVAREFIVILLTEKWLESAILMQILCLGGAFTPIAGLFSNLMISRGHSTAYMWCSIALCAVQLGAVFVSAPYGINTMISVYVAINILWIVVWHLLSHRDINLSLLEVIQDIAPYLLLSATLVGTAWLLTRGITNLYASVVVKVVYVAGLYALSLWLLRSTIFMEFIDFLRSRRSR